MPDDQPAGTPPGQPTDSPTDRATVRPADGADDLPADPGAEPLADATPAPLPGVVITYCTQCRWLLRAAWYTQELLTTFHRELGEVALRPGKGGVFTVEAGGKVVWDRTVEGGFPEITVLKRRVRDVVAPDKPLGHSDGL